MLLLHKSNNSNIYIFFLNKIQMGFRFRICWKWICTALFWFPTDFTSWITILFEIGRRFTGNNQTWRPWRWCRNVVWTTIRPHAKAKSNQRACLNVCIQYDCSPNANTLIYQSSLVRLNKTFKIIHICIHINRRLMISSILIFKDSFFV